MADGGGHSGAVKNKYDSLKMRKRLSIRVHKPDVKDQTVTIVQALQLFRHDCCAPNNVVS